MLTMADDTTLINPNIPRYRAPTPKQDTLFTGFTPVASSIGKRPDKDHQTREIREDLVRDYIAKPDSDTFSVFQKVFRFLMAKRL
jgi:hypothetical protein